MNKSICLMLFFVLTQILSFSSFGRVTFIDSNRNILRYEVDANNNLTAVVVGSFYKWTYSWNVLREQPFLDKDYCVPYTIPNSSYVGDISTLNWDQLGYYKYDGDIKEDNAPLRDLSEMITRARNQAIDAESRQGKTRLEKYNVNVVRIDKICNKNREYSNSNRNYYYVITYVKALASHSKRGSRKPGLDFNKAQDLKYNEWDIRYPGLEYNKHSGQYDEITAVTSMDNIMMLNPDTFTDAVSGYDDIFVPFSEFNLYNILQDNRIIEKENSKIEPSIIMTSSSGITYRYKKSSEREKKF